MAIIRQRKILIYQYYLYYSMIYFCKLLKNIVINKYLDKFNNWSRPFKVTSGLFLLR